MNIRKMSEILDKYYTPHIKKEVAKMKRDAKKLERQLEKDPDNIKLAIKLAMNPFNTTVKCDFLGKE
jgi:hypothetical protein